jgi:sigma-B regulation protein RsbU (phosphoserine phosphatase)
LFPQAAYEQETLQLSPGDLLTLFSDGVSEALSAAGEEFGDDRIRDAVIAARAESTDATLERLLTSVKQFSLGAAQSDDITAMVVKYFGIAPLH